MSTSSTTQTKTIEGFAVIKQGDKLTPYQYEEARLSPYGIEVEISHCGICHSDLHLITNDWGMTKYPLIPGHEIIGHVIQKGEQVKGFSIGDRIGIGWQRSSCHFCEFCHTGEENLCDKQEATCVGHFGGFANKILVDSRFAFHIPDGLASENAAPLLCGGATVFSPLIQFNIQGTHKVGVVGIGGLGHLAIQFANAFGCEVTAFSSTPQKEQEAKEFGAHRFINSSDAKAFESAKSSLDLILFTSSAMVDFDSYLSLLRPKGKLCILGAPKEGHVDVPIFSLLPFRKMVCSSAIASPHVIDEMLQFAALHNIVAKTEVFPMHEANLAIEKLSKNQIRYRAVLKNG
ncbi:MAG: Aldehyde reductase Ahr [Chlamydiae bacterium]|nr:Aldehyde reductase Ahr [Chlamydiota bacterium]